MMPLVHCLIIFWEKSVSFPIKTKLAGWIKVTLSQNLPGVWIILGLTVDNVCVWMMYQCVSVLAAKTGGTTEVVHLRNVTEMNPTVKSETRCEHFLITYRFNYMSKFLHTSLVWHLLLGLITTKWAYNVIVSWIPTCPTITASLITCGLFAVW